LDQNPWVREFPASITVCDRDGIIIEMNDQSTQAYAQYGGRDLIGTNLFDHHSAESREKLLRLLAQDKSNVYTVEKNGVKKLIYHTPWHQDGKVAGLVEFMLEIPFDIPHYVRGE